MRVWFLACGLLILVPSAFCQTSGKNGWGPWRYTDFKVSGIEFRSKCASSSDTDSRWEYQFRSRHDRSMDFVEREEHGVPDTSENELGAPVMFTLDGGVLSPVFEAQIHGTCAKVHQLKIEVECVIVHDQTIENDSCFHDENGAQINVKPVPDHPKYQ